MHQPAAMPAYSPELGRLAAQQSGLLTRAQLMECGLTPRQVDRLGASHGRGQRVLPQVYALTTGPLTRRQQCVAALLYGGDAAQLGGATTLELRGVRYARPVPQVHVLLPMTQQRKPVGFVVVRRTLALPAPHLALGLRVSPVARAAVDACRTLASVADATAVLAEVVQRRMCTLASLQAELDVGPSAGSAVPRRALQRLGAGSASAPEAEALELVSTSLVLPPPLVNHALLLGDGHHVVADLCWPQARLVVEIDSVEHHGFGPDAERTSRRRAALVANGWAVISVSPARFMTDPAGVLRDVEAAYLAGIGQSAG
jgi:hypothetical protein